MVGLDADHRTGRRVHLQERGHLAVPAALFDAYGRRSLLGRHYPAMRAWVEFTAGRLDEDGTWSGNAQLGDWLDPAAPPEDPARATTDSAYVATAFVAHSARLVADAARGLGRADDAERYAGLHRRTAGAAWRKWGDHARTTQTGCALALQFGIAPATERAAVGEALAALVRAGGGRIATGFLSTTTPMAPSPPGSTGPSQGCALPHRATAPWTSLPVPEAVSPRRTPRSSPRTARHASLGRSAATR
ncbi:hypothetical protein [Streptomyces sp. enrichment culture]|uniref:alpha-L-rhamnosidase-related protein n=1 Tax=Streptomyces sp. enrichment culture TaxID=1795815 RepID=UPI003F57BDF8